MTTNLIFTFLDLSGTFVFALSGAEAARQRGFDLFGLIFVAFLAACGGGIIRDVCIGVFPPAGISYWPYLALTLAATLCVIAFKNYIVKLNYPVLLFDALGLSMFAVAGTQKALSLNFNYQVAILLGVLSAIGGGVIRDIILGKIPVVLRKEVYGSAALIGSIAVAISFHFNLSFVHAAWIGFLLCFCVRYYSIKKQWHLPTYVK